MAAEAVTDRTPRDVLWDACRAKTCCRTTRVALTGADLGRLVEAFELDPADVAAPVETEAGDRSGFRLTPEGPLYELVLRKRGRIGPQGAPCVFLTETSDGHALCGAGAVRPAACHAFPAVDIGGEAHVLAGACTCRRWSPVDVGEKERTLARRAAEEAERHAAVVEAWNGALAAERSFAELCAHLVAAEGPPVA
jgi:Fe-S-cluster containining protein